MNQTQQTNIKGKFQQTIEYLKQKNNILLLTTSNRWSGESGGELPKSSCLAQLIAKQIDQNKINILDITKLNIYPCEGNVSTNQGNSCGLKSALLKDPEKNPSNCHRCWASINHTDDELWQVSKALLNSDCVIFLGSVRWGQMNAFYQKLIERLTWLENRHSTLGEDNILKNISAGIILTSHNWHAQNVLATQKQVLKFFGFEVRDELSWFWKYSENAQDESDSSYQADTKTFNQIFNS